MAVPQALSGQIVLLPGVLLGLPPGSRRGGAAHRCRALYYDPAHAAGMWIRAGASNRTMIAALGVNIAWLYTLVFGVGAALAGLAGMMAGPLLALQVGMGEAMLILTFVVIVIGGIGSIRGAFIGALLVGVIDTFGRVLLPPALASMTIYILMAVVLYWRPQGLFPTAV